MWAKLRISITVASLVLYVMLFNLYIYELQIIDIRIAKLFYNYLTLSMVVFYLIDRSAGFVSYFHKQFNLLCILSVIVNYVIIILTHHKILEKPIPIFYAFNCGIFLATVMVVKSMIKHKVYEV